MMRILCDVGNMYMKGIVFPPPTPRWPPMRRHGASDGAAAETSPTVAPDGDGTGSAHSSVSPSNRLRHQRTAEWRPGVVSHRGFPSRPAGGRTTAPLLDDFTAFRDDASDPHPPWSPDADPHDRAQRTAVDGDDEGAVGGVDSSDRSPSETKSVSSFQHPSRSQSSAGPPGSRRGASLRSGARDDAPSPAVAFHRAVDTVKVACRLRPFLPGDLLPKVTNESLVLTSNKSLVSNASLFSAAYFGGGRRGTSSVTFAADPAASGAGSPSRGILSASRRVSASVAGGFNSSLAALPAFPMLLCDPTAPPRSIVDMTEGTTRLWDPTMASVVDEFLFSHHLNSLPAAQRVAGGGGGATANLSPSNAFSDSASDNASNGDASSPCVATQQAVFESVGRPMVWPFIEGFHSCIVAYGQTGSGKTYSLFGHDDDPGLSRRSLAAIMDWSRAAIVGREGSSRALHHGGGDDAPPAAPDTDRSPERTTDQAESIHLTVSLYEIYNERVRDLLADAVGSVATSLPGDLIEASNPADPATVDPDNLKIRVHPRLGPQLVGLTTLALVKDSTHYTSTVDVLWKAVSAHAPVAVEFGAGSSGGTAGAPQHGWRSSRSHTMLRLNLVVIRCPFENRAMKNTRLSMMHFVDLAGSEKHPSSSAASVGGAPGATGNKAAHAAASVGGDGTHAASPSLRLRESVAINRSLATLRTVIDTLADAAAGAGRHLGHAPPYRESRLTYLLSECFGGNSRTLMLVCVTPLASDYEDTLSSLRYAKRAAEIKCEAHVNHTDDSWSKVFQMQEDMDAARRAMRETAEGEVLLLRHRLNEDEAVVSMLQRDAMAQQSRVAVEGEWLAREATRLQRAARVGAFQRRFSGLLSSRLGHLRARLDVDRAIANEELLLLERDVKRQHRNLGVLSIDGHANEATLKSLEDTLSLAKVACGRLQEEVSTLVEHEALRGDASHDKKGQLAFAQRFSAWLLNRDRYYGRLAIVAAADQHRVALAAITVEHQKAMAHLRRVFAQKAAGLGMAHQAATDKVAAAARKLEVVNTSLSRHVARCHGAVLIEEREHRSVMDSIEKRIVQRDIEHSAAVDKARERFRDATRRLVNEREAQAVASRTQLAAQLGAVEADAEVLRATEEAAFHDRMSRIQASLQAEETEAATRRHRDLLGQKELGIDLGRCLSVWDVSGPRIDGMALHITALIQHGEAATQPPTPRRGRSPSSQPQGQRRDSPVVSADSSQWPPRVVRDPACLALLTALVPQLRSVTPLRYALPDNRKASPARLLMTTEARLPTPHDVGTPAASPVDSGSAPRTPSRSRSRPRDASYEPCPASPVESPHRVSRLRLSASPPRWHSSLFTAPRRLPDRSGSTAREAATAVPRKPRLPSPARFPRSEQS